MRIILTTIKKIFFPQQNQPIISIYIQQIEQPYYCCHNREFLIDWFILESLTRPSRSYYPSRLSWFRRIKHCDNRHNHPSSNRSDKKSVNSFIILSAIVMACLACGLVAGFYLLKQMGYAAERFIYNEGWVEATVSYTSMLVLEYAPTLP